MAYPGNAELSPQAQERVMGAFRQVMAKLQAGQRDEALIGLEFVLRLDPGFGPGLELHRQLQTGDGEITLDGIIGNLDSPSTGTINLLLVDAVEDFNQHNYLDAREKVAKVLFDLPGHAEARSLKEQIEKALKVSTQVGAFLTQAREALDRNDAQEAANFVMMAQALDPHHSGIEKTLAEIHLSRTAAQEGSDDGADHATPDPETGFTQDRAPLDPVFDPPKDAPPTAAGNSDSWDLADAFHGHEDEVAHDESAPEAPSAGDLSDLFTVEEPEPETVGRRPPQRMAAVPAAPQEEAEDPSDFSGPAFDDAGSDIGDLFFTDSDPDGFSPIGGAEDPVPAAVAPSAHEDRVQELLTEAVNCWGAGDQDRARELVESVLGTVPGHHRAIDLIESFDRAANEAEGAADEPAPEIPVPPEATPLTAPDDVDDSSLFEADFPSLEAISDNSFPAPEEVSRGPEPGGPMAHIPWRIVVMAAGALVIVLGALFAGLGLFSGGGGDDRAQVASELLREADVLFKQGKGEDALHILRSFHAEGLDGERINKRIARYEAALAPPTPTPVPAAVLGGRALIDSGEWLAAFQEVSAGLQQSPGDPGLAALKDEISSIEPQVNSLFSALSGGDFPTAAAIAIELAARHSDQPGFDAIIDRSLFNAALGDLRSYQLTGARNYLYRLTVRRPDDEEAARILEFISSYTNRPVDMQLEIFVGSLAPR